MPEHHVELREAEIEGVVLVNQRHIDAVAERLREHGAEFEPAEAGAENEDALFHRIAKLFDGHWLLPLRDELRNEPAVRILIARL